MNSWMLQRSPRFHSEKALARSLNEVSDKWPMEASSRSSTRGTRGFQTDTPAGNRILSETSQSQDHASDIVKFHAMFVEISVSPDCSGWLRLLKKTLINCDLRRIQSSPVKTCRPRWKSHEIWWSVCILIVQKKTQHVSMWLMEVANEIPLVFAGFAACGTLKSWRLNRRFNSVAPLPSGGRGASSPCCASFWGAVIRFIGDLLDAQIVSNDLICVCIIFCFSVYLYLHVYLYSSAASGFNSMGGKADTILRIFMSFLMTIFKV